MNARSLELLEYDALRALLGRYVASELGRAHLAAMTPGGNREHLAGLLDDAAEAIEYCRDLPRPRFEGLVDVSGATERLRIEGASLDALEILAITTLLERAGDVRRALCGPVLWAAAGDRLPPEGTVNGVWAQEAARHHGEAMIP